MFCDKTKPVYLKEEELGQMECECAVHGIKKCPEDFELRGNLCFKEKLYTNFRWVCSLYECENDYFVEVKES